MQFCIGKKAKNIKRTPEAIARRKSIREIGTLTGTPFPSDVETLIRDLASGRLPLTSGEGIIDFRADDKYVNSFVKNNLKKGARKEILPGSKNAFISMEDSRQWKAKGFPKIQNTPPSDYKLKFYNPTLDGKGSQPGVPTKAYTVNQISNISVNAWEGNKILLVGSLASVSLGPALEKLLTSFKATVAIHPHVDGIPGTTKSSRDLTSINNMKLFKEKLDSFKPDVTFFMYSASSISSSQLAAGLLEIKEAAFRANTEVWWIGPPVYALPLAQAEFQDVYEQEGSAAFGDRYISSLTFTETSNRSGDGIYVDSTGSASWALDIIKVTHGRNKGDPNAKLASQTSNSGWDGAIPPEDCPPLRQRKNT